MTVGLYLMPNAIRRIAQLHHVVHDPRIHWNLIVPHNYAMALTSSPPHPGMVSDLLNCVAFVRVHLQNPAEQVLGFTRDSCCEFVFSR
jgi:hypothetical protein